MAPIILPVPVNQRGGRKKKPFPAAGQVREKILGLISPLDQSRFGVSVSIMSGHFFGGGLVDDEVGQGRPLDGIEGLPLISGSDQAPGRETGQVFEGLVAMRVIA